MEDPRRSAAPFRRNIFTPPRSRAIITPRRTDIACIERAPIIGFDLSIVLPDDPAQSIDPQRDVVLKGAKQQIAFDIVERVDGVEYRTNLGPCPNPPRSALQPYS